MLLLISNKRASPGYNRPSLRGVPSRNKLCVPSRNKLWRLATLTRACREQAPAAAKKCVCCRGTSLDRQQ